MMREGGLLPGQAPEELGPTYGSVRGLRASPA